ncbi:uncharacterized protein LOC143493401 isoform X2 [Brachyhypopomus gauderio]|uniref:uncharacterized protein LOC143493401 isoform X2 n=1 Tax=Brachyhypopomus gauderio TaxID=698409 RepID=UPI00404314D9
MPRRLLCKLCILLVIVLVTGSQTVQENDAYMSAGNTARNGNAFYALRSCHQVLHGDSGEFFSPDYLCSSPALWCNWTLQVHHGKRMQLYLEDLTPTQTCHLKTDQIHLDESPVAAGESRILERCWGRARYTSVTNTVHVVQLIGPNPNPPHRGFYGRFWAFGQSESSPETTSVSQSSVTEVSLEEEKEEEEEEKEIEGVMHVSSHENSTSTPPLPVENAEGLLANSVDMSPDLGSWTQQLAATTTGPWEKNSGEIRKTRGGAEHQDGTSQSSSHHDDFAFVEPVSMTTGAQGGAMADEDRQFSPDWKHNVSHTSAPTYTTHPSTMSTYNTPPTMSSSAMYSLTTGEVNPVFTNSSTSTATYKYEVTQTAEETYPAGSKMESGPEGEEVSDALPLEMLLANSAGTFQTGSEESNKETRPSSSMKPKPSHRLMGKALQTQTTRNAPEHPHLPGGLLLEVAMEIGLDHAHAESWDQIRNSFRGAVETMIQKELENSNPSSVSLKRSKKLSVGALFIVWVQLGQSEEVNRTLGVLRSTLQGLRGRSLGPRSTKSRGIIVSVSVEDIDECETQLVVCDVHADCVNEFGSYSCHCHHGYSPGLGGAVCVEAAECARTSFPMILYIICFLLSFLVALLLVVLGVLYHRYHRGAFLPRCQHGSICSDVVAANDVNNNSRLRNAKKRSVDPSSRPPPPPPPVRLSRGACPAPDLPLLKFNTLAPSEDFEGKLQSERL